MLVRTLYINLPLSALLRGPVSPVNISSKYRCFFYWITSYSKENRRNRVSNKKGYKGTPKRLKLAISNYLIFLIAI